MRILRISLLVLATSMSVVLPLSAQDTTSTEEKITLKDKIMAQVEKGMERRERKSENGELIVLPVVVPSYSPELEWTFIASVLMTFSTDKTDTAIQRSSTPIVAGISTTGGYFFGTNISTFWLEDKLRVYANGGFREMPDNYYGVGYDEGANTPQGDSTTYYVRNSAVFALRPVYQFKKNHFVGPTIDINYTKGKEASPGVAEDPYYQEYNNRPLNTGIGLVYQFDSRDMAVNAYSGFYLELASMFYTEWLGGDNTYQAFSFDARKYFRIKNRDGRILACQARGRLTSGDVPYAELSKLGTPYDLRGYRAGQYRHSDMFYVLTEYRHMFGKRDGTLSKFGGTIWAGVGTLGETVEEFQKWLPNFGIGFRFEVEPRMNLRLDLGFGKNSTGFYFNFNEAF